MKVPVLIYTESDVAWADALWRSPLACAEHVSRSVLLSQRIAPQHPRTKTASTGSLLGIDKPAA
ncbi:MAG: hypothetical protein KME08_12960 [Aphanothece sp. CMT-3BRIN-NPC111]|nr:hypothetical protein [Aphanothece sp. CMT-3BRIN-NPC111]